ncbi:MAG: DUF4105 domain-containing protein [Candidatus Eremiobacterota bacterium]
MQISSNYNVKNQYIPAVKKETTDMSQIDTFQKSSETGDIAPVMTGKTDDIPWRKDQRPATYLGTTEDGKIHIGNVRLGFKEAEQKDKWEPVFKEVSIDPSKVKDVYFVVKPFSPEWIAGHTLAYFEFEEGHGVQTPDGETQNGLVVSFEARLKEGQTYNPIHGMKKDEYKSIYQLGSWKDVVQKTCRREGRKLIRYKLNLTPEQKKEFLKNSLDASLKDISNESYHTTRNSCYSNQLHLLNSVLPKDQQITEWLIPGVLHSPQTSLPKMGSFVLGSKGIIDDTGPVMTEPDKTLFPPEDNKGSFIKNAIKKFSEMKGWHVMSGVAGIVLGTALGSLALPAAVALPTIGLIGGMLGEKTSHWMERESHTVTEPSEKYFQ